MIGVDRVVSAVGAVAFFGMAAAALLQWREDRHRPAPRMRSFRVRPGSALTLGILSLLVACWWAFRALTAG